MHGRSLIVNGQILSAAEIRTRAAMLRQEREAAGRELSVDERLALQDEARQFLIDRILLIEEARRLGLAPTEFEIQEVLRQIAGRFDGAAGCRAGADTAESREDIARRLMVGRILDHWRSSVRRPQPNEVRDAYRAHKEQFYQPEMVHASHIVRHFEGADDHAELRNQVEELRARVVGGEEFGQVAANYSDCPENNGDLGWFARGVMVTEFDEVVFSAPLLQLTPVFQTEFGFHFAIVHSRKAAGIRSFDEVRQNLEVSLWLSAQDRAIGRALAELRQKATVEFER